MFKQPQVPTLSEATLVMDSRKTMVAVRHQNLSGSWSQLYKSGGIYLDLSLRSDSTGSTLLGHLVADPSEHANLAGLAVLQADVSGELTTSISSTGAFRLPVSTPGTYRLELVIEDHVISINKLDV